MDEANVQLPRSRMALLFMVMLVTAAGNVANVTERGTPEPMLPKLPELR